MAPARIILLTATAMTAFAANSLLCRLALARTAIDPASFTSIRIVAGCLMLWLIVRSKGARTAREGSWRSALALFAYAAGFSFAYVKLSAATGTLILFGAVQTTMIGYGLWKGERLLTVQVVGLTLAVAGLVGLLLPGVSAPPWAASMSMLAAGLAWGIYSLRAKGTANPTSTTAGNFMRALPFAAALSAVTWPQASFDAYGAVYAIASGALASGLGYAIWYAALRGLKATTAATVQLSVPVVAAAGGVIFLGEALTLRLVVASVAVLGGIALVTLKGHR
ncbi:MAG: EamA family transporter [Massilia sp.]|jgi:drug/metabolite transporter (DMT)-like permease|nr:EamA family transporter [Massilia sp.]